MTVAIDATGMRDAVRSYYREVVDRATETMLADMERDAPRDTGNMTQTVELDERDTDERIVNLIRFPAEYASYQDEGVPGPIYPRNAKVLHFFLKDGTEVFVKSTRGVPRTGWFSDKFANWTDYLAAAK